MSSLCPICGRFYCDHTPAQRGQSYEEMMREPSDEEVKLWESVPNGDQRLIDLAQKNAHNPVK